MTKEESLQILDNCLKQLEAIPEDELFDYFYERSPSFRKAVNKMEFPNNCKSFGDCIYSICPCDKYEKKGEIDG